MTRPTPTSHIQRAIDKQAKLDAEATEGPWKRVNRTVQTSVDRICECDGGYITSNGNNQCLDARLIAHLRNQAKLARAVIEAAKDEEEGHSLSLTRWETDLGKALKAWADHVLAEP